MKAILISNLVSMLITTLVVVVAWRHQQQIGEQQPTVRHRDLITLCCHCTVAPYKVAIKSNRAVDRGFSIKSPNGEYRFRLSDTLGNIQLRQGDAIVWEVKTNGAASIKMQPDGNLVARYANKTVAWSSHTNRHPGAFLTVSDNGQLAVLSITDGTPLWLAGNPEGGPFADLDDDGDEERRGSRDVEFPVRGSFYYPWFPETWTVKGEPIHQTPNLGLYSSSISFIHRKHIEALLYTKVDVAIASWFGPDSNNDRARITALMKRSEGTSLKWSIYHEIDRRGDTPTAAHVREHLDYLEKWFTWRETYAHVDGKPVIFVYNLGNCEENDRWVEAARGEWYVSLKQFPGHLKCRAQPDSWHQYGPATAVAGTERFSLSISPGFWRADLEPSLERLSRAEWKKNVLRMIASKTPWQLITTFNEWGEGTAVEAATEWASTSGYGFYQDVLHFNH